MKHASTKLVFALFPILGIWGGAASATPTNPSEAAVRAAETQRFEAVVRNDIETVSKLTAEDLIYTHSNGMRQGKTEYLQLVRSGKVAYKSIEPSQQRVHVIGDTAVITGAVKIVLNDGADRVFDMLYTDVYVQRDGRWQLLAWHASPKAK